jgi:hypothetical protein
MQEWQEVSLRNKEASSWGLSALCKGTWILFFQ